jgi:hypothetical protein
MEHNPRRPQWCGLSVFLDYYFIFIQYYVLSNIVYRSFQANQWLGVWLKINWNGIYLLIRVLCLSTYIYIYPFVVDKQKVEYVLFVIILITFSLCRQITFFSYNNSNKTKKKNVEWGLKNTNNNTQHWRRMLAGNQKMCINHFEIQYVIIFTDWWGRNLTNL